MEYDQLKVSDETGEAVLANITADRAAAATTLKVDSVDNWPQKFIATAGTKDANGYITPASMTVFYGHLSAGDIIIDGFAPGYTDSGNTSGQVVVIKPNTYWADQVVDRAERSEVALESGWVPADETWVYASATTVTVPTDATTKYSEGMLVKLTQPTDGDKYYVITNVASTVLTLQGIGGADLDNEAITNPYFSTSLSPFGVSGGTVIAKRLGTPVAFRAYLSSSQSIGTQWTKINLDTEAFDLGSNFDAATNHRFVAPYDGVYHFSATASISLQDDTDESLISLYVNGSSAVHGSRSWNAVGASKNWGQTVSSDLQLSAGDYVELYTYTSASESASSGDNGTFLSGHLVGRTD